MAGKALRRYTPEEIDTGLLTLAMCGGNSAEASKRLAASGLVISDRLLRVWRNESHSDRYTELCGIHQPEIEKRVLALSQEIEMRALTVSQKAMVAAEQQLDDGDAKDPAAVAKNLTIAYGVLTDKSALRQGKPTSIIGNLDARDLISEIRRDLGDIEGTAEDHTDTALLPRASEANARG